LPLKPLAGIKKGPYKIISPGFLGLLLLAHIPGNGLLTRLPIRWDDLPQKKAAGFSSMFIAKKPLQRWAIIYLYLETKEKVYFLLARFFHFGFFWGVFFFFLRKRGPVP